MRSHLPFLVIYHCLHISRIPWHLPPSLVSPVLQITHHPRQIPRPLSHLLFPSHPTLPHPEHISSPSPASLSLLSFLSHPHISHCINSTYMQIPPPSPASLSSLALPPPFPLSHYINLPLTHIPPPLPASLFFQFLITAASLSPLSFLSSFLPPTTHSLSKHARLIAFH